MWSLSQRPSGVARRGAAVAAVAAGIAWAPRAHADPAARPRFEVALGMGASLDDAGLRTSGASPVPAFFVMAGFGSGVVGIDLGLFTNSANGRFRAPNVPVDRLGLDAMLVVRPGVRLARDDRRYGARVARAAAIDLGLGYERDSRITRGPEAVDRFGLRLGAHIDIPLTAASDTSELRLRLAVRRFVGAAKQSFPGGDPAPDTSGEVFAALAAVF